MINIEHKDLTIKLIKNLYEEKNDIFAENGEKIEITKKGSLGLLALGYKGIIAWRKARGHNINFEEIVENEG